MKKWMIVTFISILLIAASVIFAFVYLLPKTKEKKFLDAIFEGNKEKMVEYLEDFSAETVESLKDDVKDIVVYTHNQYAAGQKSYDSMLTVYENIETIRKYKGLTADSMTIVQEPLLLESYEKGVGIYDTGDAYYKERDRFKDLYRIKVSNGTFLEYLWDDASEQKYEKKIDSVLDAFLKEKYTAFKAGEMDMKTVQRYVYCADDFWNSAYVSELRNQVYYDELFSSEMTRIEELAGKDQYFDALSYVDSVREYYQNNEFYAAWKDAFEKKSEELDKKAREFYPQLAIEYMNNGDRDSAETIVRQLKERFGEDFDVSAIEAAGLTEWQKAYLSFMENWASGVEEDFTRLFDPTPEDNTAVKSFDDVRPDRILLLDLNKDDIPELIFDNGKNRVFIYSWLDGTVEFLAYLFDFNSISTSYEFIFEGEYEADGIWRGFHVVYYLAREDLYVSDYVFDQEAGGDHMYFSGLNDDDLKEISREEYEEIVSSIDSRRAGTSLPFGAYVSDYDSYIRSGQ